ncbi:hypothetical protein F5883DRAFT_681614 [Diaporthe sp. PMI_573]|nr:hypothetical protein F5883DRAFT_681614 [Diaporthaceae sp. PMI_573]
MSLNRRGQGLSSLLSPHSKTKYEITALCNSSVESEKKSVEVFNLSPETKTYGDAAQFAADPDVDLVVCNVRVDRHHEIIRPSTRDRGGRTMIGAQGKASPVVAKIRELLEQGRIGKVLSCDDRAAGGSNDRLAFTEFTDYFTQRSVGGNFATIGVGNLLDAVQFAIGELINIKPALQIQRQNIPIENRETKEIIETAKSDVTDLAIATGTLRGSPITQEGATSYFRLRRGQSFLGGDPLVWTINGEKGDIRPSSPGGTALQAAAYSKPVAIELHDHEMDKLQQIEWDWSEWQKGISIIGRNTGTLYENYVNGDAYPTFEDSLKFQLEEIMVDWMGPVDRP